MFTSIGRIIKYGSLSFWRSKSLTAVSVFIMTLMISLLTTLAVSYYAFDFLIARLQDKIDVSVYFNDSSEEQDIFAIAEELEAFPEVKDVEYVSREEALQRFTELHKNDPKIMESLNELGENPLPPSLNIRAKGPLQYAQVSSFLEQESFKNLIAKIDYFQRKPVIDRVFALTSNLKTAGIISVLILGLVAIAIIFNQIRMAIFASKEEIKIMRLVGSPNWFVRGPFVVQGALIGFCGIVITVLIFGPMLLFLDSKIALLYPGLRVFSFFKANFLTILLVQAVSGLAVGIISSSFAVRKYLRV